MSTDTPENARPLRFTVIAVINFGMALGTLLWIAALVAALDLARRAGYQGPGVSALWAMVALSAGSAACLVGGGVGLLKVRRWGWILSLIYTVLAAGAAVLLLCTGGSVVFATGWLVYPVVVAWLLTAPEARRAVER